MRISVSLFTFGIYPVDLLPNSQPRSLFIFFFYSFAEQTVDRTASCKPDVFLLATYLARHLLLVLNVT